MMNLQEKEKERKSPKECSFTKAGPLKWVLAWRGTPSEAARGLLDCESEIERPEDQKSKVKNQSQKTEFLQLLLF